MQLPMFSQLQTLAKGNVRPAMERTTYYHPINDRLATLIRYSKGIGHYVASAEYGQNGWTVSEWKTSAQFETPSPMFYLTEA